MVVYKISGGYLFHRILEMFIHVRFVSLVNLIAGKELVKELIIEDFTVKKVEAEIRKILTPSFREKMLSGYDDLIDLLGNNLFPTRRLVLYAPI